MRSKGFTIVELLIVIVVIAILAAISVAAYTNIQDRANDAAVQSDVSQIAKKLQMHHASEGSYPDTTSDTEMTELGIVATKDAYGNHLVSSGHTYNLLVCASGTSSSPAYLVIGASKSGKVFGYSSSQGSFETSDPLVSRMTLCPRYGVSSSNSNWLFRNVWVTYL